MRSRHVSWLALWLLLLAVRPAFAADDEERDRRFPSWARARPHGLAVTLSPVRLIEPMVALTGEYALDAKVSVAATFGLGFRSGTGLRDNGSTATIDVRVLDIGASLAYDLLGDFDNGIQLGVLGIGRSLKAEASTADPVGGGVLVAAFVGAKATADFGLTGTLQLGVRGSRLTEVGVDAIGDNVSVTATAIEPHIDLLVGWAF